MTGAAFGRELTCTSHSWSPTLWPSHKYCDTTSVDFSVKFETEKHSFSGSAAQKSEIKAFRISQSPQLDFIPLDILTEFPNMDGLVVNSCNLPILKSGLFKAELQKIEHLNLWGNIIEVIEPEAFQFLINLKWLRLGDNNIQSLPYRLFGKNPDLIYIDLRKNKINAIHPSFFDGLYKLKLIESGHGSNICIYADIGCTSCQITQSGLREKLQGCFDNCSNDRACQNSHLAQETLEHPKNVPETTSTEKPKKPKDIEVEDPSQSPTAEPETEPQDLKMVLEGIDEKLLNMTEDLKIALAAKIESENEAIKVEKCCKSNQEAIENLNKILAEKINCGLEKNLQTENELLTAQLEIEKLKVKALQAELEKRQMEMELQNLKREIDLEARIAAIQGKLENIERAMQA
jgi:Leucine-rich repeat (LRR) protein